MPIVVREINFMGGISVWQLLIILVIVVLLFGTKRLKGISTVYKVIAHKVFH